jgi:endoglucanase
MFGMWDLTAGAIRGRRLHSRVCDDLMGAASILALLDLLARARHPGRVLGIFTRAEETGFIGCQGLLRSGTLARDVAVIGLECSPRRATAKVGLGPVVRVGDKQSIFQPWITHHLQECAASLRERHEKFVSQRALMDGGICESTAYNLWDVAAGGLCLALGNYHNCGPRDEIAAEFVDWDDFESLVALMREAALRWRDEPAGDKMRARLNRMWSREYKRLAASAARIRAARE